VGFDDAAGRLIERGERKRRAEFETASALPAGDRDSGFEGFLA